MAIELEVLQALALLIAANATPVMVAKLIRNRWAAPLDFGHVLWDGERLFGSHKTWRGLICGVAAASIAAALMAVPVWVGAGFGAASLLADAVSSSVKRRMRIEPGREFPGLDQLGEALLPLLLFARPLSLDAKQIIVVTLSFCILDLATARLRHGRWLR